MNLENLLTLVEIRKGDVYLTVETPRPHKRLVKYVGPVGSSKHYDAGIGAEAIHLGKELVKSILPLVVAAETYILSAGASHCVNLVDEHNAGSLFFGLREQIPDPGSTDSHEHLHEVRAADAEERHVGLTRYSLGQQGLSGSGRAYEQSALGDLAAESSVFLGVAEEIHNLHHFFLGSVQAGDIFESHLDFVFVGEFAVGFAHIERIHAACSAGTAPHVACHAAHHEDPQHHQDHQGEPFQKASPDVFVILYNEFDTRLLRQLIIEGREGSFGIELG